MLASIKISFIKISLLVKKKLSNLKYLCHRNEKELDLIPILCMDKKEIKETQEKKIGKKMAKFTKKEEVKGGKDSHKGAKMPEKKEKKSKGK